MTIDQYVEVIADKLRAARTRESGLAILQEAESTLDKSKLSDSDKRYFWDELLSNYSTVIVVEKQDNTALNAVIAAIQAAISDKKK